MFIWTVQDAVGAVCLGIVLLLGIAFLVLIGIDKVRRKFKAWRKSKAVD
jgi:hypothetical protein